MINLLPPEEKHQLRAARINLLLLRYNVFLLGAIAFLGIATGITYFYLTSAKANAEQTISENKVKVSAYSATATQAEEFRSNLATAKQILDHEVTYSKVIIGIAQILPSGVILTGLSLDAQTFGTETTLTAQAKNYDRALALKDAFQASPLFMNVHFQSITTAEASPGNGYPVAINLNVTIKKDAAK
ncbi:MAG TPA: PilN domain-containing protein [Candidatus Saccharimonadales bacterium]|nr:PilN domain-containing protein [Candidatus Saccharimonadales bacterium]